MKRSCGDHLKGSHFCPLYKMVIIIIIALVIFDFVFEHSSIFFKKWYYPPFSLHLNEQDLYLAKGDEFKLRVIGINKWVDNYYSTDFKVAGVNFEGKITAYRTGNAMIVVKVDKKKLKCRVNVLDLNKKKLSLSVGETFRLKMEGAAGRTKYTSSNKAVATVNRKGEIRAKKRGRTIITVKARGLTFRCTVTVKSS